MKNNLEFLMASHGTNPTKLSRDIKVSRSTIYRILNGGTPSAEVMMKLSSHFGKPINEIFFAPNVLQIVRDKKKDRSA